MKTFVTTILGLFIYSLGTFAQSAPVFTSSPVLTAVEDALYSYTAEATDSDIGDVLVYTAPTLPGWLLFDEDTHELSGTPDNSNVGDHSVILEVTDGTFIVNQSFTITVSNTNDAPTFTSTPVLTAVQDALYTYTAEATDIDIGDVLIYSAPVLPGWLLFDINTHILSGTPGNDDVGDHNVTLSVSDGTVTVDQSFVISVSNINDAPVFTSTPVTTALQGSPYSYTATADDPDGDGLIYSAPVLPGWMFFSVATHILSGTPGNDDVGNHNVTLRVSDGTVTVDQSFVISVGNINDAPVFTSTPVTTAQQGTPYTYTATADDPDGDALIYSAPVLPAWLLFDINTHILSGTPGNDDVGDHNVTLRVSDGTVTVDQSFVISVGDINDAPVFTSTPLTAAQEDVEYVYTVTAEDPDGDALIYSAPLLPGWLLFDINTHILSGTPGNDDVGDHPVTLSVSDGTVTSNQEFVISVSNVNDAPVFTSTPPASVLQGSLYSYTATAEDIDGDELQFTAPVLPLWLTFNTSTHILLGSPENSDVGDHDVTLRIFDGTAAVYQDFIISVGNVNDPPFITSQPVTEARPGSAYQYTVIAEDPDGDNLTYSAPVLPAWLTFNPSTYMLSATPGDNDVGAHDVTLRVSDGTLSVNQSFTIDVGFGNHAPTFTSDPATSAVVGTAYIYSIKGEDIDGDELTYSAPLLPGWLTFYPATNVISGIPGNNDLGIHQVVVRLSDGTVSSDQSFPISVYNQNDAPSFTSSPVTTAYEGVFYTYTASAADLDDDALTYSAPLLPGWLSFDISTHVLSGTPAFNEAGTYNVTLRVTDGIAPVDQNFTITVEEANGTGEDRFNSRDQLLIYPNPGNGRFRMELPKAFIDEVQLEIIDAVGKVLLSQVIPSHHLVQEEYDLSEQPAGLYFIKVSYSSGYLLGRLIIK